MEYDFREIERKWQAQWKRENIYAVSNDSNLPKCYVLDMFPYPSGAGLHVGHPLGYIASDIYARYKRSKGFNVLHPMGYDSFGLPAEQYALDTGQHPAVTTENNIKTFRAQLDKIGFSFDWSREVRTSDPSYYRWTQWIFLQLFRSWYNKESNKAEPLETLIPRLEGFQELTKKEQEDLLMNYRLAYCSYGEVNWCEALGTVLANDEVINGVSERGGFPVVKRKLRQWYLRITEYAERLLEGLNRIEFSEAMKEMQTNWIGKSSGAEIEFDVKDHELSLRVYTTRPDTIFGVDFMVISPEHELVEKITAVDRKNEVEEYVAYVKSRSERERMAEKRITGAFTGAYALNPFNKRLIPIWISEYVLAGYGTGAIMAVPCGDERDFRFARNFGIPITNIIGDHFNGQEANPTKEALLQNSDFLDGVRMADAMDIVIERLEKEGKGVRKINYKIRDAAFSRQRYWGEPFPIKWIDGIAVPVDENELPVQLPAVSSYSPGPDGEGPLANIPEWTSRQLETNTMPGYAGSSWYFLRYMDPHNHATFCDRRASDYWNQVDLYIGGTEHAVGHLLYSRMWTKVLFDLGHISFDEPFKRLVNQGMIQGSSRFVYRVHGTNRFVSLGLKDRYQVDALHVDVNLVDGVELDLESFRRWREEFADAEFELENGKYITGTEVEKMSKSKYNTVNPDVLVEKYGADTFRMYEMFLGPIELSKPWDTKGIEGVHRFLKKLWRLFFDESRGRIWVEEPPANNEWKILHRTIKRIEDDNERFSFNTGVSLFMITVNELTEARCHKKEILEPLLILLNPYAPHITEELWRELGNQSSIIHARFPKLENKYLVETSYTYPISVNGKKRTELNITLEATQQDIETMVKENDVIRKWLEGKDPDKVVYVKGKMINVVVKKYGKSFACGFRCTRYRSRCE
jgi:leucyl-tRNA synthetase